MNGIELLVYEHTFIKRMLIVARVYCLKLYKKEKVDFEDIHEIIDFIRNYADKHHHGKEEVILFNKMVEEIKGPAEKLVNGGMLVEHDLGRLFMQNLDKALKSLEAGDDNATIDVIANLIGYADLLTRHIDKEDTVVYKFAIRKLAKETIDKIDEECVNFEKDQKEKGVQEKYIELLKKLEIKNNI